MSQISELPDYHYKYRGYPHFDHEVSREYAQSYVKDTKTVQKHPFYPFLKQVQKTPRYKPEKHKIENKERPILYASHRDAHIYAWYGQILSFHYEQLIGNLPLNECVLAYRPLGKCNIDFAEDIFDEIEKRESCTALALDLTKFFDTIDHANLKSAWCKILGENKLPLDHYKVYRSITKYAYVDREIVLKKLDLTDKKKFKEKIAQQGRICTIKEFHENVKPNIEVNPDLFGIPQGSPISAILSNISLIDFDRAMSQHALEIDGVYRRYCDDILWICPSGKTEEIQGFVKQELKKCGNELSINEDKTQISKFYRKPDNNLSVEDKPSLSLQYLGFTFDGERRLLRSQTISRYYRKMTRGIRAAGYSPLKKDNSIRRRRIYENYSHLGKRNFITYAQRSSGIMESPEIKGQVRNHWKRIHKEKWCCQRLLVIQWTTNKSDPF